MKWMIIWGIPISRKPPYIHQPYAQLKTIQLAFHRHSSLFCCAAMSRSLVCPELFLWQSTIKWHTHTMYVPPQSNMIQYLSSL